MIRSSMPFSLLACVTALSTVAGAADTTRRDVLIYSDRTPGVLSLEWSLAQVLTDAGTVTVVTDPNAFGQQLGDGNFAWAVVLMKQPSTTPAFDSALRTYVNSGGRVQFGVWKDIAGTTVPAGHDAMAPTAFVMWTSGRTATAYEPARVDAEGKPIDPEVKTGYHWPSFDGVGGEILVSSAAVWSTSVPAGAAVQIVGDPCDCYKIGKRLQEHALIMYEYDLSQCDSLYGAGTPEGLDCAADAAGTLEFLLHEAAKRVKKCVQICNQNGTPPTLPSLPN